MTPRRAYRPSAIESTPPLVDLTDPEPVAARLATRRMLADNFDQAAGEGLVGGVSEVVTNAYRHGHPPVRLRGWVSSGEATVTVTDLGEGPTDSEAGLSPATRDYGAGGFGLWLTCQLCSEVMMGRHPDGFTVRLVARS